MLIVIGIVVLALTITIGVVAVIKKQ